jgi:hypothetical protein
MSFLSGLFGRTKYEPTTRTVQTVSKLPEEIAPYVTDILEDAQAQYDKAVAEGYQPYGQETIAPRTPEEEEAIAGLRSLIGGQGKYIDEAEAALRGIDTEFTAETAQKFMSPYQQAVTDIEKRKAEEDFRRRVMPEFERQAVEAGGMSGLGSRAGVQAALLGEAFSQQLGDIQAKGQQKAYEDAYRQFTDQATRQRAQAEDLRNVGLQRFQTGLAEQGLGQKLAQEDRQEAQNILDKKFLEYLEREQFPQQKLAEYSGLVYGNPLAKMADTTQTTSGFRAPNAPGIGQQLLGLGLSGLNVFGMGGGFDGGFSASKLFQGPGGSTRSVLKTGGRIVHRQEGGEVPNIYNNPQASPAGGGLSQLIGEPVGSGFLGGLFDRIVRPRQTNVIENIDNAAGSLNDYKELMDQNILQLKRASAGISRTYDQTFGDRPNLLRLQSPGFEQKADTFGRNIREISDLNAEGTGSIRFGMKAGGGLGSLPVVKRQMSGQTNLGGTYTPGQVNAIQLSMLNPAQRRRFQQQQQRAARKKLLTAQKAPMVPPTQPDTTGLPSRVQQRRQKRYEKGLQKFGDQFKGLDFSLGPRQSTIANVLSDTTFSPDMYGTATPMTPTGEGLPSLPQNKASGAIDANVANKIRRDAARARSFDTILKDEKKIFDELEYYDPTKRKEMQDQREKDLNQAFKEADSELEKINIEGKAASDKFLADQKKSIKEMSGYPGGIIADAIEAGLERPSIVTMLTTVFNKTAKGLTERSKEVSAELRKLAKIEYDMGREQRADKKQILEKKANRQLQKIGRQYDNKLNLLKLPTEKLAAVRKNAIALSQIESNAIDQYIDLEKVLTAGSKGGTRDKGADFTALDSGIDKLLESIVDKNAGTIGGEPIDDAARQKIANIRVGAQQVLVGNYSYKGQSGPAAARRYANDQINKLGKN